MKRIIDNRKITAILIILASVLMNGCNGFFDPIEDPDTGKDVTLLILDMNFFTTRVTYKFIDAKEGFLITAPATVSFSGKNANDIVTFSGKKNQEYTTAVGELELTLDPGVDFSETNPFEFAVNAEIEGYTPMSKGVRFTSAGKKTVEIHMSKQSDQEDEDLNGEIDISEGDTTFVFSVADSEWLKSAKFEGDPYEINYSITLSSILKFKDEAGDLIFNSYEEFNAAYTADPANFISLSISTFSGYLPWIDVLNLGGTPTSVIFQLLETGSVNGLTIGGVVVGGLNGGAISSTASFTGSPTPDYFGFAELTGGSYTISGTDTTYYALGATYKLIKASDEILCPTGTSITFESTVTSSFNITADVYDRQVPPELITTINFNGNFPETFEVENTPSIPVTLVFRDNNPSLKPIPDLEIDDFCTGSETVTVEPQDGYEEYQIVLKAFCPDNPTIAVAPTYSGEFRLANSSNPWQGTSMIGGVVDLLGLPGQEYEYRLLWENDWEYTTLWTEFDASGNYLHDTDSRSITSKLLNDGRIQISIEHEFKQSVCDDLGW